MTDDLVPGARQETCNVDARHYHEVQFACYFACLVVYYCTKNVTNSGKVLENAGRVRSKARAAGARFTLNYCSNNM
jgi:hypothetical protein